MRGGCGNTTLMTCAHPWRLAKATDAVLRRPRAICPLFTARGASPALPLFPPALTLTACHTWCHQCPPPAPLQAGLAVVAAAATAAVAAAAAAAAVVAAAAAAAAKAPQPVAAPTPSPPPVVAATACRHRAAARLLVTVPSTVTVRHRHRRRRRFGRCLDHQGRPSLRSHARRRWPARKTSRLPPLPLAPTSSRPPLPRLWRLTLRTESLNCCARHRPRVL